MAVWGGLTNSYEKKRSKKQRRKGKITPTRREKTAFFSDHYKDIEENNRMKRLDISFKKIREIKGTFHAKMGSTKDRNGSDLTEAEDI